MSAKYERHALSAHYPMMTPQEMASLEKRLLTEGFDETQEIVLYDGKVLDGWNRYQAALKVGVEPLFRNWEPADGTPLQYVLRHNHDRRHLSPSQLGAVALEMAPLIQAEEDEMLARQQGGGGVVAPAGDGSGSVIELDKTRTAEQIAQDIFGVSDTMMKLQKRLQKNAPDLYAQVLDGSKTANAARVLLDEREATARANRSQGKEKAERAQALEEIATKHGKTSAIYKAAEKSTILKAHDDLMIFAGMPPAEAKKLVPLLNEGWTIKKAQQFLGGKLMLQSSIEDLINTAIVNKRVNGKDTFEIQLGGWNITLDPATPETPAAS